VSTDSRVAEGADALCCITGPYTVGADVVQEYLACNEQNNEMKDALLRAIGVALDGIDVGYCAFDSDDRTLAWNASFLELFPEHDGHVHEGEAYADNLRRFYAGRLDAAELPRIDRYIAEGIARHRSQRRPYEFDHRAHRVRVSSFEIGRFGRVRVWRKVAALPERAQRPPSSTHALADLNAMAVLERLADGVLIVDVSDKAMWANQAFRDLYGLRSEENVAGQSFDAIYRQAWASQEDDRAYQTSVTTLTDNQRFAGAPFELKLPENRWVRVIEQRGEIDGRGYFVHVDVTHFKLQQAALEAAEERYRLVAEYSSDIILAVESGSIAYASPALTELLGWQASEVLGGPLIRFCHPDDIASVADALRALRGQPEADYRARALHRDGSYVWVEARARRLPGEDDPTKAKLVLNLRGIAARKAVEEELERAKLRLEELATTDALTGLANRRKLDEVLALECRRSQREGRHLALLLLDIDRFKKLNDTYGHQAGDEVLRRLGDILLAHTHRAGDLAARFGGEEFVLLLPGADPRQAAALAEKVRHAVEATDFEPRGVSRVTLSVGVASVKDLKAGTTPEALVGAADEALYTAKRDGRNRVVVV
jgi:diguanylate cyclase (GGDEF)-like protein/PAS domain S-box-containing protein